MRIATLNTLQVFRNVSLLNQDWTWVNSRLLSILFQNFFLESSSSIVIEWTSPLFLELLDHVTDGIEESVLMNWLSLIMTPGNYSFLI